MQNSRKQFSFPQFRFPWEEAEKFENMEKKRGKAFSHHTQDTLISVGYPCSYSHLDHGMYSGCTVDHDVITEDIDISKGVIFRRNIKEGILLAKTLTQPLGDPNIEYNWRLDKPVEYPDAIEQHQYLTKRYTRNIGMFDTREHAVDELCEDIQFNREQVIRSNILVTFGNRDTPFRKYIVHPTGENMDRLVMRSLTFSEKPNFGDFEVECNICELPFEIPKLEIIKEKQLFSEIRSIQYISIEGRDEFSCNSEFNYFIFEANPLNSDETFKQTLEAIFPKTILSSDLSPHIRNESVVLLESGLLYIVSKHTNSRSTLPEEHIWISVIFGPHPRYVICANEKSVFGCQLKQGRISSFEKLYKVSQDRIITISRHPTNSFIFALASLTKIFLLDIRQPFIPYFSINAELSGPIEFLLLLPLGINIKVLVNNRDGEARIFAFSGGVGLTAEGAPNPPYQTEMLIQSDSLENNLILLAPEIYFSCRKRFETNIGGTSCLFLAPSTDTDLTYNIIISISLYGDINWQQLIQTRVVSLPSSMLIKPTNEDYRQLINWANKARDQYFENFRIQEIYFDFLVESMEYFHGNKILKWLFREDDKCYTCCETKLKFNTKNFPSLNKLYFQSGWPKYSNWAKCDFGNQIPVLRYTRVSFKDSKAAKRKDKLEKKNYKRHLRILPNSILPQSCTCQLTIQDFVSTEELNLPWEKKEKINENSSNLFSELWASWPSDTIREGKEKPASGTGTGTNRCLEVIEEISGYFEQNEIQDRTEFICEQSNDFDNIPGEPAVATVIETKDKQLTPFPKKGAKNNKQVTKRNSKNSKENTNKQKDKFETSENKQTDLEIYSSDPDWPMDWTDFSNSSFPNYDFSVNVPSLSQMSQTQSTPQRQVPSGKGNTPVKKEKRKIGF